MEEMRSYREYIKQQVDLLNLTDFEAEGIEKFVRRMLEKYDLYEDVLLTPEELLVLCFIASGNKLDDISMMMNKSKKMVSIYIKNMKEKLKAKNLAHAVYLALL